MSASLMFGVCEGGLQMQSGHVHSQIRYNEMENC